MEKKAVVHFENTYVQEQGFTKAHWSVVGTAMWVHEGSNEDTHMEEVFKAEALGLWEAQGMIGEQIMKKAGLQYSWEVETGRQTFINAPERAEADLQKCWESAFYHERHLKFVQEEADLEKQVQELILKPYANIGTTLAYVYHHQGELVIKVSEVRTDKGSILHPQTLYRSNGTKGFNWPIIRKAVKTRADSLAYMDKAKQEAVQRKQTCQEAMKGLGLGDYSGTVFEKYGRIQFNFSVEPDAAKVQAIVKALRDLGVEIK